ncbi:unnamed protein product, partial [Brassica napus]
LSEKKNNEIHLCIVFFFLSIFFILTQNHPITINLSRCHHLHLSFYTSSNELYLSHHL